MSLSQPVLAEFLQEAATTRRALERVRDDCLDWRPHEKSWTMRELASHLAEMPTWLEGILNTPGMNTEDTFDWQPFKAENRQELLDKFDKSVSDAERMLSQAADEALKQTWSFKAGDKTIFEAPRVGVVKTMLINHAVHHRGQLTVYLRLNDIPVPSIYGPSADEQGY